MSIKVTHNVDDMDRYWEIWWDRTPLEETVDAIVVDTVLRLEDDEHGPDGKRWEPWSDNPAGAGYASTRGPGDKLLFASGDLRDSIESKRTGGAYIVGSDRDYAQVHQFGSRDGRTPERQYVGVSDELERALDQIYGVSFDAGWGRLSG